MTAKTGYLRVLIITCLEDGQECAARNRLERLAASLKEQKIECIFCFESADNRLDRWESGSSGKIIYQSRRKSRVIPRPIDDSLRHTRALREHLRDIVRHKGIDCVLLYSTYSIVIGGVARICRELGVPLVMDGGEFYSVNVLNILNGTNIMQYLSKWLRYKEVDGMICCSPRQMKYAKWAGRDRTLVPAFMVEPCAPIEVRSVYERLRVCMVASLSPRELPERVIDAAIEARKKGLEVSLDIIGRKDGSLLQKITNKRLRAKINNAEYIKHWGFLERDEMLGVMRRADCFVLLRKDNKENSHAFPTRIPELIGIGKPLVLSDTHPLNVFFKDQVNCIMVKDTHSCADLVSVFRGLLCGEYRTSEITKNALELMNTEFSSDVLGKEVASDISL